MTEYQKYLTNVVESILDRILSRKRKIWLGLGLKNNLKGLILNLENVYYLSNSLYNLVNLGLFNNSNIYYNNEFENFYQIGPKKVLV